MNRASILVFSADSFAAALLGAAVELAGYQVVFPLPAEAPREAVLRLRPGAALVDCDHAEACTEAFFGPALMVGARVAVFSSSRSQRALEPIAAEFGVRIFRLPLEFAELGVMLTELTRREP